MNSPLWPPLIIGLHRVGFPPRGVRLRGAYVSPRHLRFIVRVIRAMGFEFTTLQQAMQRHDRPSAVLTFDDGYEDNVLHGLPVLREMGVPATVFAITGDVGRTNVTWPEAVEQEPASLLDWPSLRSLAAAGWEIGSHAHRHVHLDRLSEAEQSRLVAQSLVALKENLGVCASSFAYPFSAYDRTTVSILASHGVRCAVTTSPPPRPRAAEAPRPLELGRVCVGGTRPHHYLRSCRKLAHAVGPWRVFVGLLRACGLHFADGWMARRLALRPLLKSVPRWRMGPALTRAMALLTIITAGATLYTPRSPAPPSSQRRALGGAVRTSPEALEDETGDERQHAPLVGRLDDLSASDLLLLVTLVDSLEPLPSAHPDSTSTPVVFAVRSSRER